MAGPVVFWFSGKAAGVLMVFTQVTWISRLSGQAFFAWRTLPTIFVIHTAIEWIIEWIVPIVSIINRNSDYN